MKGPLYLTGGMPLIYCGVQSLTRPIQIIGMLEGDRNFLYSTHLQTCYHNGTVYYTKECVQAFRMGITQINPSVKRIHAYRFVKASLDGWPIELVLPPSRPGGYIFNPFITNYRTCRVSVLRIFSQRKTSPYPF
jgi:hypothetical protein